MAEKETWPNPPPPPPPGQPPQPPPQPAVVDVDHLGGEELSDYAIQMIHSGLLIPNSNAIRKMAREIRKWRGVPNPDLI